MTHQPSEFESVITDDMRALIGKEGVPAELEITAPGIRAFARAVGLEEPLFYDRAEARRRGFRDLPAPPGFFGFPVFDPHRSDPVLTWPRDPNALLSHPFHPIHSRHTDMLAGANDLEYLDNPDLCAGDVLVASTALESLTERYSKALGGPMLIQTTATTFKKHGRPVAVLRMIVLSYTPRRQT